MFCSECWEKMSKDKELRRKVSITIIAVIILVTGWEIFIFAAIIYSDIMNRNKVYYLPGILGTIALIVVNVTPFKTEYDHLYDEFIWLLYLRRLLLLMALIVAFICFLWGIYIFIADFLIIDASDIWAGLEIMLQNTCIFVANLMIKYINEELFEDEDIEDESSEESISMPPPAPSRPQRNNTEPRPIH